jgi:hypothetical protein
VTRLQADDVRAELSAVQVIQAYGLRGVLRGSQYRLRECPRCHEKSRREAIAIDARTGSWLHHGFERNAGGACSGDVLDLVAACEGLDCRRDFARVMERAAQIAGVTSVSDVDREQRQRQIAERVRADAVAELERMVSNRNTAGATWNSYARFEGRGMRYLEGRGLRAAALVDADAARFAPDGVAVAIRDVEGRAVNVARRIYEPGVAKVMTMKDHSTRGTMIDAVADVRGGCDVVVIEGVMDALTARIAWPAAVVLGANGAGNVPKVVESAIARIKLAGARLSLVPHDDEAGHHSAIRAGQIALAAGVEPIIVEYEQKDLNDAWQAGWRP